MSRSLRNSDKRSSHNDFYRGDDKTERRALFNPQSDHPIGFNKPLDKTLSTTQQQQQRSRKGIEKTSSTPGVLEPSFVYNRSSSSTLSPPPTRSSRGVLWDPNTNTSPSVERAQHHRPLSEPIKEANLTDDKSTTSRPKTKENNKMDEHRSHLKMLLNRIQKLETKVTFISEKAHEHPYFLGIQQENNDGDRTTRDSNEDESLTFCRGQPPRSAPLPTTEPTTHPWLTMTDDMWITADQLWKDKMTLHLQLANAYLDVIQYDYGFAEKKSLFSLCWKRAIYSLVEKFRQAFRRQQMLVVVVEAMSAHDATSDNDDDLVDDAGDFLPVMTENGMTMVQLSDDNDDDNDDGMDKQMLQKVLDKHLQMLKTWMETFLLVADGFYQQAMVVLRDLDIASTDETDFSTAMTRLETSLHHWRRTKRWKWYQCIPYRGDLARYRFIYGQKKKDYELAWRWYTLGVWLIPATGRFYFHQSLLLNSPQYSPLYELHKLYFGVRSLIVRRNGFVNAREGLVTLFENNRQWKAALEKKKERPRGRQRRHVEDEPVEPPKLIAGLFIRLHGMIFTKIDLDSFTLTKRRYFETLFAPTPSHSSGSTSPETSSFALSCQQLFWLETILLNLSSLYSYDYVSSTLTKAITLNKKCWVAPGNDQQQQDLATLLETLDDSILFGHSIDLVCQVVIELLSRYMKDDDLGSSPSLPALPPVSLNIKSNETLLFGTSIENDTGDDEGQEQDQDDNQPWLIYIHVLLYWMVVTGIGVRSSGKSIWESIIGQVARPEHLKTNNMDKITRTFWSLLAAFLSRMLKSLPETQRYQLIDRHLLDSNNPWADDDDDDGTWDDYLLQLLGPDPVLPEDEYLRGLGWLDDLFMLKTTAYDTTTTYPTNDLAMTRRIRILDFGFTLVKQMYQVLEYDPVQETFLVKTIVEESRMGETEMLPILTALDDAVLFDSTMPLDDDNLEIDSNNQDNPEETEEEQDDEDEDDMMGQLKKRRQHLQSMLATMTQEKKHAETFGYQKLYSNRGKEREARLNRIREKVIPGQTVLVLDTNCFIGHIDAIKRLIQGGAWSIVIPLVVITELDGLKGNAPPLGTVAGNALELIETTLASKQLRRDVIRIQTSHHNFMYDISIRSEQFIFGESDKNLDDLILSTCLWWKTNKKLPDVSSPVVPVCLVTADRNLSVKARARDVQVIPVSGLMEINPVSKQS